MRLHKNAFFGGCGVSRTWALNLCALLHPESDKRPSSMKSERAHDEMNTWISQNNMLISLDANYFIYFWNRPIAHAVHLFALLFQLFLPTFFPLPHTSSARTLPLSRNMRVSFEIFHLWNFHHSADWLLGCAWGNLQFFSYTADASFACMRKIIFAARQSDTLSRLAWQNKHGEGKTMKFNYKHWETTPVQLYNLITYNLHLRSRRECRFFRGFEVLSAAWATIM